jgi:hypothetical protein
MTQVLIDTDFDSDPDPELASGVLPTTEVR